MRDINKIIIHCSATVEGRDYTVSDINIWHVKRGFDCCGYHYVIYRDGTIATGRALEKIGAHCKGYNKNSIGICYIGGLDAYRRAKDTRTDEQKKALDNLIEVKICVRVLHDSKQLSLKQFAYLCEKMVEVEDQLKKWKAYYQNY